jgi:hypothetical protein
MGDGINILVELVQTFLGLVPPVARAIMLDAKLDPDEGEDETRLVTNPEINDRLARSLYRRWFRAANYQRENIERAVEGRPVDNCPRLTRAKRNLWKVLKQENVGGTERKAAWRESDNNRQHELDQQAAIRAVRAEAEYLATVTIDGIECERPIIAADTEGMDDDDDFIVRDGVKWPNHHTILMGAGGVGFKDGQPVDLPMVWAGHDDKRPLTGIEMIEFFLSLPEKYGPTCSIVGFSFNYDVTMLLKALRQEQRMLVKVGGQDFQNKGRVTLPILSHKFSDVRDVAVEFLTPFISEPSGRDSAEQDRVSEFGEDDEGRQRVVRVARVIDMVTGETRRYVGNAIIVRELERLEGGYVGRKFAIRKLGPKDGKRYNQVER